MPWSLPPLPVYIPPSFSTSSPSRLISGKVDAEEASLRYRVLQALVGTKRLDELELEIRDKVQEKEAWSAWAESCP